MTIILCTKYNIHCASNMNWPFFFMDSSKKCHNSVSFQPIFNFKTAIEI